MQCLQRFFVENGGCDLYLPHDTILTKKRDSPFGHGTISNHKGHTQGVHQFKYILLEKKCQRGEGSIIWKN